MGHDSRHSDRIPPTHLRGFPSYPDLHDTPHRDPRLSAVAASTSHTTYPSPMPSDRARSSQVRQQTLATSGALNKFIVCTTTALLDKERVSSINSYSNFPRFCHGTMLLQQVIRPFNIVNRTIERPFATAWDDRYSRRSCVSPCVSPLGTFHVPL